MRCCKQTTTKLGKPNACFKSEATLAVNALSTDCYCIFPSRSRLDNTWYSCFELCSSSAAFPIKTSELNFPAPCARLPERSRSDAVGGQMARQACEPHAAPELGLNLPVTVPAQARPPPRPGGLAAERGLVISADAREDR